MLRWLHDSVMLIDSIAIGLIYGSCFEFRYVAWGLSHHSGGSRIGNLEQMLPSSSSILSIEIYPCRHVASRFTNAHRRLREVIGGGV